MKKGAVKKDLVIGVVGTLILLTAMVGVFRYEANQRGASYDVAWTQRDVEAANLQEGTNEGEETPLAVNVTTLNVTRAEFVLEWTDNLANSGPDEFRLVVQGPAGGAPKEATGSGGSLSVVFENLSLTPEAVLLLGSDEAAVRDQATRQFASSAAVGAWNVTVALVDAGDLLPVPGAPAGTPVQDGGNYWTLRVVLKTYEATLTAA